jgi:hypothetical protein
MDWHVITPYAVAADALCRRDEHDDFPRLRRRKRHPRTRHVPHFPKYHGDDTVVLISRSIIQSRLSSFSGSYGCYGLRAHIGCRRPGPLRLVRVYWTSLVLPLPGMPEPSLAGGTWTEDRSPEPCAHVWWTQDALSGVLLLLKFYTQVVTQRHGKDHSAREQC